MSKSENGCHIPRIFSPAGADCAGKRLAAGHDRWKIDKRTGGGKLERCWFGGPHASSASGTFRRRTTAGGDRAGADEQSRNHFRRRASGKSRFKNRRRNYGSVVGPDAFARKNAARGNARCAPRSTRGPSTAHQRRRIAVEKVEESEELPRYNGFALHRFNVLTM